MDRDGSRRKYCSIIVALIAVAIVIVATVIVIIVGLQYRYPCADRWARFVRLPLQLARGTARAGDTRRAT